MYATRRLLRAPRGVPGWAQHMAKQPTKAGRLPPTQWANAPDTTPERERDDYPEERVERSEPTPAENSPVPPTDWKAAAGTEARAWEDIRRREEPAAEAEATPLPEGARYAPPRQGPYGPQTDRSKGFMDSFRSLTPNQRILIGATFFIFGLGIYAYDSLVQKEEEVIVSDDLRERLAKASAVAKSATSEGLKIEDVSAASRAAEAEAVDIGKELSEAAASQADALRAAEAAVSAAAARGVNTVFPEIVVEKERVAEALAHAVAHVREEAHATADEVAGAAGEAAHQAREAAHAAADAAEAHLHAAKGAVADTAEAAKGAVADTVDAAAAEAGVVAGTVPDRTSFFGIRLR